MPCCCHQLIGQQRQRSEASENTSTLEGGFSSTLQKSDQLFAGTEIPTNSNSMQSHARTQWIAFYTRTCDSEAVSLYYEVVLQNPVQICNSALTAWGSLVLSVINSLPRTFVLYLTWWRMFLRFMPVVLQENLLF